jgi:uncharacterized protein (DUF1800 family)
MSITRRGPMLLPALLLAAPLMFAQSVSVMPTSGSVAVGGTFQFSKSTMMLMPETVTWSVAGIPQGNSTVGTIDATGLYHAPAAVPSPSSVLITATSTANPLIAGNSYVTVTTVKPTITLSPGGYVAPTIGTSVQFTATVKNLASNTVTWAANGIVGGNSTAGTITQTGLYTAPMTIPVNPVQVSARSTVDTTVVGSQYVYIVPVGPTITAVTPNPLPTGSYTMTVTGSGFQTGATIIAAGVQLSTTVVNANTLTGGVWMPPGTTSAQVCAKNVGTNCGNTLIIPVSGSTSNNPPPPPQQSTPAPVVSPSSATVPLAATQQFTASNVTSWTASAGTIDNTGLYTAPAVMPATPSVTITATGGGGSGKAIVTLIPNTPPAITGINPPTLPLGVFAFSVQGTNFIAQSVVQLNGKSLPTTLVNGALNVTGFAGTSGPGTLVVVNGPLSSPAYPVQVGVPNPLVSASAARRFLEQAAFGPTPSEADHVQSIGFQAWIQEQFNTPQVSNYAVVGSQGGMGTIFLANAVTNPDQLRQRVAFALSQIFVTSMTKLIWNTTMVPYQHLLLQDTFTNYRQILGDVTLSPAMGNYLDMANNAKANAAAGTVANENYAREVLQLFSIGTAMLNSNGTPIIDLTTGLPAPAYDQTTISELARVFTGWTYAPPPGGSLQWNAYLNNATSPMQYIMAMHDTGAKTIFQNTPYQASIAGGQAANVELNQALNLIANHPNTAPFICKQLIQHLVKSNPSPAYVQNVVNAWTQSNGDMKAVITAVLMDGEARANDQGGADQPSDGHLQEPALLLPGLVRAFGGKITPQNYYGSEIAAMGQDIFNPASVFNYYSPGYTVANTGGLKGPEFQIDNPNNAILRENLIGNLFNAYQNPIQTYGPGTTVDLTAFVPLAATPSTLVDAIDLTLTHGTMPAGLKSMIVAGVTGDANGNIHRVQTAVYLTLQSSYYSVWH